MEFAIRAARAQDAEAIVDVWKRSIVELCVEDHRNDPAILNAWLENKTPQTVLRWLTSSENAVLVPVERNSIVGVGLVRRNGELEVCYVAPEATARGVGTKLLEALEHAAKKWGVSEISLKSTATARRFYQRRGYMEASRPIVMFGGLNAYPLRKAL
jgi:GNAT superfamily N-acetyltransferase